MAPWPVDRRNSSAQIAPIAKKTTPKVPINSANNFWVRLYTQSPLRTRETFSENGFGLRDSTEFVGIGQNRVVLFVRRDVCENRRKILRRCAPLENGQRRMVASVRFVASLRAERLVDGASWSKVVAEPPHSKSSGRNEFWRALAVCAGAARSSFGGRARV